MKDYTMDLYDWVSGGFSRFSVRQVWEFDNFWERANTHHAYLRFAAAVEQRFPNSPILPDVRALRMQLIDVNSAYFLDHYQELDKWADDYGWWGLALLASSDALKAMGDGGGAEQQLMLAQTAWKQMIKLGYDGSNSARPVPFGCANKALGSPSGAKNTVTNANLLLLSVRLYAALAPTNPSGAQPYRAMMHAQLDWFDAWFNGAYDYFRTIENGTCGLAQERPIAEPDYVDREHPMWEPGWVWSGDQGLLVAALAESSLLSGVEWPASGQGRRDTGEQAVNPVFSKLMSGVRQLLFGEQDAVLREAPFNSSFGPVYAGAYVAGRGILMRYLSEPSVRRVHGSSFAPEAIQATASAVWNSRDTGTCQFAADWTPGNNAQFNQRFKAQWGEGDVEVSWNANDFPFPGVLQAAGLDVLTAAMSLG